MKKILATMLAAAAALGVHGQLSYTNTPNAAIPNGSPVGLISQFVVSGAGGGISSVTVALDITGGFNGDLYAYLLGPQGQVAVLLNRPGSTGVNPFGNWQTGLNLVLDQSASGNIHNYASLSFSTNGSGQVIGAWLPDGRLIDPQSAGSVFDTASTLANLSVFDGLGANGVWTLLVADLGSGGGNGTLHQAILTIMTVPEPQAWVMLAGGMATLLLWRRRKRTHFNSCNEKTHKPNPIPPGIHFD